MANLGKLAAKKPVRAMIVGFPGSAKTGSLASLANAGFKLRILDFDGNLEPLFTYVKPEFLDNIDAVSLEDKTRFSGQHIVPAGKPMAFQRGLELMDHWKYTEADGTVVDLGRSQDWGCDTIVVLDSLTAMGLAAKARIMHLMNKTPTNTTDAVWGVAMQEQEAFIEKLTASENKFHVIVLAHLKMISPKESRKGEDELTKELKEKRAELIPTRYYPSALGQALPPVIGGHFPILVEASTEYKGSTAKRVLKHLPRAELDLKVPALNLPERLDISDGMLKLFDAVTPGIVANCLKVS